MARHIIFKCPRTMNVQHRLDEVTAERSADAYKSVDCPACTLMHFIHRETGKLLGEE
jgi:phage FluMu protein Com